MIILLLAFHILIAVALVGVVLMQKSEGGALGSIGGGGGMSGFMTGRTTANLLTRATAILFALFVVTSVSLVLLNTRQQAPHSILGHALPREAAPPLPSPSLPGAPPAAPALPGAAVPAPAAPSAPLAH